MTAPAGRASEFGHALRAELSYIARSRWDLVLLFVLPPVLLAIVATMLLGGVIRRIPVAVVDQDHSALSRAAIRRMEADPTTRVVAMPLDLASAWPLVRSGTVYSVAFLPKGLSQDALRDPKAAIIFYNAALLSVGDLAASAQADAVTGAAARMLQQRAHELGVPALRLPEPAMQVSVVGNQEQNFELFLGGLVAPGVLHLLMACAAVAAFGRELRGGSLADWAARFGGRLLPATLGKALPYVAVFTFWGLAWIAWLAGWRGWGIAGSPTVLVAALIALMTATAAISALLVALTGDTDTSYSASAIYAGSAIAFSNGTLPLNGGPEITQVWSAMLPYTHYLRVQNAQMVMGADPGASLRDIGVLAGVTLVAGASAVWLARWRSRRVPRGEGMTLPLPPDRAGGAFVGTLTGIFRTRELASILLLAVVAYAFYYPLAYAGQTAVKLPVAVVDHDHSPLSRELVRALDATRAIDARTVSATYLEAQHLLRNGGVDGVILVPRGFEQGLLSGAPRGVAIDLDGAYLVRVSAIGKTLTAVVEAVAVQRLARFESTLQLSLQRSEVVQRPLYNTSDGYGSYAVPAVSAIILQQTLLLGAALVTAIRRESGAAALRTRGFVGMWGALVLIGVLGNLFYFGFVDWFQDYPRMGDPWGALLTAPLYAAAASALGLVLGTCFDRHTRVMQIIAGTSVPLFFLGGAAWPMYMMPDALAAIAHLSPATSAIQAFVKFNSMGASIPEAGTHLAWLALLAAGYGTLAWWRTTRVQHPVVATLKAEAAGTAR